MADSGNDDAIPDLPASASDTMIEDRRKRVRVVAKQRELLRRSLETSDTSSTDSSNDSPTRPVHRKAVDKPRRRLTVRDILDEPRKAPLAGKVVVLPPPPPPIDSNHREPAPLDDEPLILEEAYALARKDAKQRKEARRSSHSRCELIRLKVELRELQRLSQKLSATLSQADERLTHGVRRVWFAQPLVTLVQYRPKTELSEIEELYFQEEELDELEYDRETTELDQFELIAQDEFTSVAIAYHRRNAMH